MDEEKRRILVVDDEERNLRLIEAMLAPLGHEAILARDGHEALAIAGQDGVDLVLLDVMMPGMDGFEVARRLRQDETARSIPIVMVTALREVEHRVKALEAGADDLLSKPVDSTELKARVCSLLKVKAYNDHMRTYQQELEAEVASRTQQLSEAFRKLEEASLDTINRLSAAAEYKDEDTGAHIVRMGRYAATVAQRIGLDAATVKRVLYSAPMHDIGKIGVPDRILLKPGKLGSAEWDVMKRHTTVGANILAGSDSDLIQTGERIALSHHEKRDGSGYPNGINGQDIPIEGRITAIADVLDALTSRRPYKEPFPLDESLSIIAEGRGTHFDPHVVDAFFEAKDQIVAIKTEHEDEGASHLASPAVLPRQN